jgi:hypothetical protein
MVIPVFDRFHHAEAWCYLNLKGDGKNEYPMSGLCQMYDVRRQMSDVRLCTNTTLKRGVLKRHRK